MDVTINIDCPFCEEKHIATVSLPEGWDHLYGGIDDEIDGFCPKHSAIAEFAKDQCPGCVGGWGDCELWNAFAYNELKLSKDDFDMIERGRCPKRVNGTMMASAAGVSTIDISSIAPTEAGKTFVEAIREYCEKYHRRRSA